MCCREHTDIIPLIPCLGGAAPDVYIRCVFPFFDHEIDLNNSKDVRVWYVDIWGWLSVLNDKMQNVRDHDVDLFVIYPYMVL